MQTLLFALSVLPTGLFLHLLFRGRPCFWQALMAAASFWSGFKLNQADWSGPALLYAPLMALLSLISVMLAVSECDLGDSKSE
jgi:glucose-6-phosphate-specific signal transduction histidine kinase